MIAGNFARDLTHLPDLIWYIRGVMFAPDMFSYSAAEYTAQLLTLAGQFWMTFFGIGALLGLVGIVYLWRQKRILCGILLALCAAQAIFFTGYAVFDKWSMFHTAYLVWTVFAANGMMAILRAFPARQHWVRLGLTAVVTLHILLNGWLIISLDTDHVRKRTETLLQILPHQALVFGQWQTIRPLQYYQIVEGLRRDLQLVDLNWTSLSIQEALGTSDLVTIQTALDARISQQIACTTRPVYVAGSAEYIPDTQLVQVQEDIFEVVHQTPGNCGQGQ
jgi:hypothetical protein